MSEVGTKGVIGEAQITGDQHPDAEQRGFSEYTVEEGDAPGKEIVDKFTSVGLPLDWQLQEMLLEEEHHNGNRKGSGFTQATRFLADMIRTAAGTPRAVTVFDHSVEYDIRDALFEEGGEELVRSTDIRTRIPFADLEAIYASIASPSKKLIVRMIVDILGKRERSGTAVTVPTQAQEIRIGTCTSAELYFYEYINPENGYIRNLRWGDAKMNFVVDNNGKPLFMEKIGLGENHSAIALQDIEVHGVELPAGSLVALQFPDNLQGRNTDSHMGSVYGLDQMSAVQFLRLTPLVSSPEERVAIWGSHIDMQKKNDFYKPEEIRLEQLIERADREVKEEAFDY